MAPSLQAATPQTANREIAYTIWVNEKEMVASFHPVDGYVSHRFDDRERFTAFQFTLVERGFRFQ